jgi:hypothetical protein
VGLLEAALAWELGTGRLTQPSDKKLIRPGQWRLNKSFSGMAPSAR